MRRLFTAFAIGLLSAIQVYAQSPAVGAQTAGTQAATETPGQPVVEAEALILKSDWKGAEAKITPWLADHPTDARALFDAGYVADAQNKLDEAAGLYRRAVEADPRRFEAHLSLGLLLARQGKPDEARPELEAATKLDPGDAGQGAKARAWRALALLDRTDNPAEASNDLLEALKLSPETPEDTLLAAELAEKSGQGDAAEAAYRRLLAKDPGNTQANAGLAHLLIARKQFAEAETLLRGALEKSPEDPALSAQLAAVLAAQDKAEALPMLQKLHTAHPGDPAITRMLLVAHGQNLIRQQKFAEAFSAFSRATELDGANPDGWSGLAFAASKLGKPEVTLHALTMRSKYLPDIPSTYFLWATSYDTLHDKTAAITYYHHFLEAAAGKFPNQEWQARQRLLVLEKKQ